MFQRPTHLRVVVLTAFLACGCSSFIAVDYYFRAEGLVVSESGQGLPGVRVSLEFTSNLHEAAAPLPQAVKTTDENGQFLFFALTHTRSPSYTLLFEKPGYKTVVIEGAIREMSPYRVVLVQQ
jgi:hypothetical protein